MRASSGFCSGSFVKRACGRRPGKGCSVLPKQVAVQGGYVYQVTSDLKLREGEGRRWCTGRLGSTARHTRRRPGVYRSYERTGKQYLLDAALSAARCLLRGQLHSGGWQNHIDFDPELRTKLAYRVDGKPARKLATSPASMTIKRKRRALLDEGRSSLQFKEADIHAAVQLALESILKNQFPSGAWAQASMIQRS